MGLPDAPECITATAAPGAVHEARAGFLGELRGLCDVARAWPGQEKVRSLTRRSSTFILMAHVCVLYN